IRSGRPSSASRRRCSSRCARSCSFRLPRRRCGSASRRTSWGWGPAGRGERNKKGHTPKLMPDKQVDGPGYGGNARLMLNLGPQHPSSDGVFRMILTLEGETVVGVDAVIGYLHRCHEKLGETLTYVQYPSIASKTDYVAAMTSELAYVSAVEKIAKFEVPRRAQYLRLIVAELQRIASHCLWLGTWCLDMGGALGGGATVFLYCIREREMVLDRFEELTGARL